MLSNVLIVVLGFFIWLAWLTSGIQHKIIKGFDLSCLFWSSFCCPQNKCPPLFIPFLGLTFRGVVLFCTVKQLFSPCLSLFIHPLTFFWTLFSIRPFSFSTISSSKLWSLNDILRKMPTGLYLFLFFALFSLEQNHTDWCQTDELMLCILLSMHCSYFHTSIQVK